MMALVGRRVVDGILGMDAPPLAGDGESDGLRPDGGPRTLTFLRRHPTHACWTCLRFTGSPPRAGSDATNLTFLAGAGAAGAEDMAALS